MSQLLIQLFYSILLFNLSQLQSIGGHQIVLLQLRCFPWFGDEYKVQTLYAFFISFLEYIMLHINWSIMPLKDGIESARVSKITETNLALFSLEI